ncbi:oxidoreductase [Erythrobacter sp. F6033]|uniref:oxidoreductase n=1 Tax=Erythrobacter sp. F6033 TaxID=2926401 RepID=UPI001FF135B6|nr:oxidoreductase [Erythrobacter sp. F6033]MCK0127526.1 oxidoreductase [Erythrobacter sp. F6033]
MAIADQVPVNSGFPARTDGADVIRDVDLVGKTAIVTGGYSGIGLETVRALANQGARVIVPARSRDKATSALASLSDQVEIGDMDLGDIASVRRFASSVSNSLTRVDLLINNAGIMACPETRVGHGWEAQFGTNHLGHMALALGLMDVLCKATGARVITLSSTGHKLSNIRWDDIQFTKTPYEKWTAYGQSKTANALFANALSRRLKRSGGLAFSVHPGGIFTPLQRHLSIEEQVTLGWLNEDGSPSELAKSGFKTPEQGCSTTLWAATSDKLDGKPGVYCEDCDIAVPTELGSPTARFRGVDAYACDDEAAERLWETSEATLAGN